MILTHMTTNYSRMISQVMSEITVLWNKLHFSTTLIVHTDMFRKDIFTKNVRGRDKFQIVFL